MGVLPFEFSLLDKEQEVEKARPEERTAFQNEILSRQPSAEQVLESAHQKANAEQIAGPGREWSPSVSSYLLKRYGGKPASPTTGDMVFQNEDDFDATMKDSTMMGSDADYTRARERFSGGIRNPQSLKGLSQGRKAFEPTINEEFMEYLRKAESQVLNEQGLHKPYTDLGKPAIGYGHNLKEGEVYDSPIPEDEARKIHRADVKEHLGIAERVYEKKYGKGSFNKLPVKTRQSMVGLNFGTGDLAEYDDYMAAANRGDLEGMRKEHRRSYVDPKTKKRVWDERRNKMFYDQFLGDN